MPEKREAYDRYGHAGVDPNMGGGGGFGGGAGGFADSFGDIFGDIFGGGRGRGRGAGPQVYRGADLRYNLEITLEQAAHGFDTTIRVPSWDKCDTCHGSGAKPGTSPTTCTTCAGHGQVRMQQGFFSIQQTCPKCHGSGKVITDPCAPCGGQGRIKRNKTLEVKIPAGIDNGMRIRSSGNGEPGTNGGPAGDLYVEIHIKPHAVFQREGDDLHCEMPISFVKATLGGEIEVPTLSGKVSFTIPEGTQSGKTFRLKAQGHQGRAFRLRGRPVLPRGGRNAGQADRQAEGPAAGIRAPDGRRRRQAQPAKQGLDGQGQGLLRVRTGQRTAGAARRPAVFLTSKGIQHRATTHGKTTA